MHDLIFSEKLKYEIDLTKYISKIQNAEDFTSEIIDNLLLAGIDVVEQTMYLVKDKKSWILKLKRD